MKGRLSGLAFAFVLSALIVSGCGRVTAQPTPTTRTPAPTIELDAEEAIAQFEDELEDLRQQHKIPGFSAAIVKDQELDWAKSFGYADLENNVEATP